MKTKIEKNEEFVPTALRQVWEWKDAIYQETKQLSTCEMLRYIHEEAGEIVRQLNLRVASFPDQTTAGAAKLAETPPPYGGKKQ
jgi:hypothetical protein